jgi:hypothetical protein
MFYGTIGNKIINPMAALPSIASLAARYRADLGVYDSDAGGALITVDGTAVGRWEDQAINLFHVTQATAGNRPLWKANIINRQPALLFDGTDDALRRPVGAFDFAHYLFGDIAANIGITNTAFFVHKPLVQQDQRLLSIEQGNQFGDYGFRPAFGDGTIYYSATTSTAGGSNVSGGVPVGYVNSWRTDMVQRNDTALSIKSNGVAVASNNNGGGNASTGTGSLSIGGYDVGFQNYSGYIAEILIYAEALSAGQIAAVEAYLRGRYATY